MCDYHTYLCKGRTACTYWWVYSLPIGRVRMEINVCRAKLLTNHPTQHTRMQESIWTGTQPEHLSFPSRLNTKIHTLTEIHLLPRSIEGEGPSQHCREIPPTSLHHSHMRLQPGAISPLWWVTPLMLYLVTTECHQYVWAIIVISSL